ncbi:MAG: hypothetical protein HY286_03500 [Planctomycetes bacterium]|nr:hypothetical protein [Planctomycetota bacterium]
MEDPSANRILRAALGAWIFIAVLGFCGIARAEETRPMVDLTGLSSRQAFAALTAAGFTATHTAKDNDTGTAVPAPGVTTDFVIWQSVPKDAATTVSTTVQFNIITTAIVPDLETMDDGTTPMNVGTAVDRALRAGRFIVKKKETESASADASLVPSVDYTGTVKKGSQTPAKGTRRPIGDVVDIVIEVSGSTPPGPGSSFWLGMGVGAAAAAAAIFVATAVRKKEEEE